MPVPGSFLIIDHAIRRNESSDIDHLKTVWFKLGEDTGPDSASNFGEKWSKSHHDLMHPYRVIAPESSKKC